MGGGWRIMQGWVAASLARMRLGQALACRRLLPPQPSARNLHPRTPPFLAGLLAALLPVAVLAADAADAPAAPPPHPARQRLVQVLAPQARSMAVNERLHLLAVGVTGEQEQLRLLPLAADGTLGTTPPQTLNLPKPAAAAKVTIQPLAMV